MDTVFKIIIKDNETYLGANHFGYDDLTFKGIDVLVKVLEDTILEDDYLFLKDNFYSIDGSNIQDIEVILDKEDKEIYFDYYLDIKEVNTTSDNIFKTEFENEELLFKKILSFKEFKILYNFFLSLKNHNEVLINNKYLYKIKRSGR